MSKMSDCSINCQELSQSWFIENCQETRDNDVFKFTFITYNTHMMFCDDPSWSCHVGCHPSTISVCPRLATVLHAWSASAPPSALARCAVTRGPRLGSSSSLGILYESWLLHGSSSSRVRYHTMWFYTPLRQVGQITSVTLDILFSTPLAWTLTTRNNTGTYIKTKTYISTWHTKYCWIAYHRQPCSWTREQRSVKFWSLYTSSRPLDHYRHSILWHEFSVKSTVTCFCGR